MTAGLAIFMVASMLFGLATGQGGTTMTLMVGGAIVLIYQEWRRDEAKKAAAEEAERLRKAREDKNYVA